jgi:hypothetical protein
MIMGRAWPLLATGACGIVAEYQDAGRDSSAADAETGVSVTSPRDIFGGCLWWDADDRSTIGVADGGVSEWRDKGSSSTAPLTLAPISAPGNAIAWTPDAIREHAAMKVGVGDGVFHTGTFGVAGPTLIAIVAKYSNGQFQAGTLFNEGNKVLMIASADNTSRFYVGFSPPPAGLFSSTGGWNDGRFHSFGLRASGGGRGAVRVDGVETAGALPSALYDPRVDLRVGGNFETSEAGVVSIQSAIEGYIAEVIIANTEGTDTQIAQLSAYFTQKYGIPF